MGGSIHAIIRQEETGVFVVEVLELPIVTQGNTIDEAVAMLREAVAHLFEDESPRDYGLVDRPALSVTLDLGTLADAG